MGKPISAGTVKRLTWRVAYAMAHIALDEEQPIDVRIKAAHAHSTAAGVVLKAIDGFELEKRIIELERERGL